MHCTNIFIGQFAKKLYSYYFNFYARYTHILYKMILFCILNILFHHRLDIQKTNCLDISILHYNI